MSLVIPDNLSVWISTFLKAPELKWSSYALQSLPSHSRSLFLGTGLQHYFYVIVNIAFISSLLCFFFCECCGLKCLILWQIFSKVAVHYVLFSPITLQE